MEDIGKIAVRCIESYTGFMEIFERIGKGDWSKVDLILENHPEAREHFENWRNGMADFRNAISAGKVFSYSDELEKVVTLLERTAKNNPFAECSVKRFLESKRDQYDDQVKRGWCEQDGIVEALDAMFQLPNFDPDKWLERKILTRGARVSADSRIPKSVTNRFAEAHACYIYGNFLATIAMSRSVLEFILKDKYPVQFKNLTLGEIIGKGWNKIPDLKKEASKREGAERINSVANNVLHFECKGSAIVNDMYAQMVIKDLRDVIEFIYT